MITKPIIFNTEMVKAILDGRKAQTRRVVKPQPPEDEYFEGSYWYEPAIVNKQGELEPGNPVFGISSTDGEWGIKSPYKPGDILYVRETWCRLTDWDEQYPDDPSELEVVYYRADYDDGFASLAKWRPSIHMPKKAARIFLRVKNVRVERLQDITEEDARSEGCIDYHDKMGDGKFEDVIEFDLTARDAFSYLWDTLNAKRGYGWDANPWVWVIEFERIESEGKQK